MGHRHGRQLEELAGQGQANQATGWVKRVGTVIEQLSQILAGDSGANFCRQDGLGVQAALLGDLGAL
jgi:hypothetical protein